MPRKAPLSNIAIWAVSFFMLQKIDKYVILKTS